MARALWPRGESSRDEGSLFGRDGLRNILLHRGDAPARAGTTGIFRAAARNLGWLLASRSVLAVLSLRAGRPEEVVEPRTARAIDELLLQEGAELVSGITNPFTESRRNHELEADAEPDP